MKFFSNGIRQRRFRFVIDAQNLLPDGVAQPARKRVLVGVLQPFTRKFRKR